MKSIDDIKRTLPFVLQIVPGTFGSEVSVNGKKGTVVVGFDEAGYEHVSFSAFNQKNPSWDDMCVLKDMFWEAEEEVYQIMPKKSEYVNIKKNCLHLWRPKNGKTLNDLVKGERND